jgi:enediyne biosynthesis protein E4
MSGSRLVFFLMLCPLLVGIAGCGREFARPDDAPASAARAATPSATPPALEPTAKAASPVFRDMAAQAGLRYRWQITGGRPCNILQTIGNGCAFLDYDGDGNLDILLIGRTLALYRGDGRGRFVETTATAGLDKLSGHFLGCAVGDYDNDGWDDIYVSAYRGGVLLHNEGGRRFREVTAQAGILPQPWGSSCTFADVDGDGRLDLYIGNYVHFGPEVTPQLCESHGFRTSCGPADYTAERGILYRNRGVGRFQDVTKSWGFLGISGKTLGVAAGPLDRKNRFALALANDQVPGDLISLHGAASKNAGEASGMARNADGNVYGGMGIDWGDYDNDGLSDLVITTFRDQAKPVFRNQGGVFAPQDTAALGMHSSLPYVAFGTKWLDYDNDGWLDVMFANGHVQDNIEEIEIINPTSPGARFRQPTVLYHNQQGRRFEDASTLLGDAARPIVGRGLATGDYDNDGKMDALITNSDGTPLLLHNVSPDAGNWLLIRLEGRKNNRDGYGALITVEAGGKTLVRHAHADGSYLSSSDKRVHVGLGAATTADVTVQWPGGAVDHYRTVKCNRILILREGASPQQENPKTAQASAPSLPMLWTPSR